MLHMSGFKSFKYVTNSKKKLHKYTKNILTHIKTIKIDLYVKANVFEILENIKLRKKPSCSKAN